jgi:hypothetical protein
MNTTEVISSEMAIVRFDSQAALETVYGYTIPVGVSVSKAVKDSLNLQFPGLTRKELKTKFDAVMLQAHDQVTVYQDRATTAGYTKQLTRVNKNGDFTVKYIAPKSESMTALTLAEHIKRFNAKNPQASGNDVQKFIDGLQKA